MDTKLPVKSRIELKFVTKDIFYHQIKNWVHLHKSCFKKVHHPRFVNNVYFDNNNLETFTDNIFGNTFRSKLRFRWYGDLSENKDGNFEIKYKKNIYGWKEKFKIKNLSNIYKTNWNKIVYQIKEHLPSSKRIYFEKFCIPSILNRYYREYYISHDGNFRITIDKNIDIFDQRSKSRPNIKTKVLRDNNLIVEIKFDRNLTSSLQGLLDYMPIRNSRNSKYINSIRQVSGI